MLIWGAIWGAILCLLLPDWGDLWVLGALFGLAAGWSLRKAVRTVVRKEIEAAQKTWVSAAMPTAVQQPATAATQAAAAAAPATAFKVPPTSDRTPSSGLPQHLPSQPVPPSPATALEPLPTDAVEPRAAAAGSAAPDSLLGNSRADVAAPPSHSPRAPSALDQALGAVHQWLVGGNTIVRAGLVILFIGLSFLARYAAQAGLLPVELRLAAVGAVGVALLAIGYRQRTAKPAFGLTLQGGGVAVLYLTVFAAFRLYHLVPQMAAFAFMVLVCAFSCALALLQNSRALAFAAFAGGFATPLLVSTGGGSHIALFSYYTLLNVAILFIATRRAWRALNLLGFVATFGIAVAWGVLRYNAEHYASAQAFLAVFMAIFIATAILYARATPLRLAWGTSNAVDSTLVFGTPLLGFGLQVGLAQPYLYGEALSALAFGAVYLVLAALLLRRGSSYRLLTECFLALGVGFVTLAVPLALEARWTSAVWALEGAAAFWVGARQARWMPRAFGLLLQGLACLSYFDSASMPVGNWPLAHPAFMGAVLIALPALAIAWWARRALPHSGSRWAQSYAALEALLPTPLLLYGFVMWLQAWSSEFTRRLPASPAQSFDWWSAQAAWSAPVAQWLLTGVTLLSAAALLAWGRRASWAAAAWPSRLGLPVLVLTLLTEWGNGQFAIDWPAWLGWPLALALHVWLLRRNELDGAALLTPLWRRWLGWQHTGTAWLVVVLIGDALVGWIDHAKLWGTAWASVTGVVTATLVLALLTRWAGRANRADARGNFGWPLNPHAPAYYWFAAAPLALLLWLGALALAWTSSGHTAPLPYIPLLNPTDLALLLAMGALLLWRGMVLAAEPRPAGAVLLRPAVFWGAMGFLGLVVLSTVWLRVAHHFFDVRWNAWSLYHSFVVQTGYAILWTLTALALMVAAHRRGQRPAWLAGAALLALVVVKLLLVDLSNRGGAERIVAFIGVGVLMLVVGYFAPLPPKAQTRRTDEELAS